MGPWLLAIGAGAIGVAASLRLYNQLVGRRNAVDNAFATIDVQLKLRCDLVPRVVEAVRGHMDYERATLEELTSLRARASAPNLDAATRFSLDSQIGALLTRVIGLAERYPALEAGKSVLMLQRTLNEVEAQIAAARRTYNAAVTEYNTQIESFPALLAAGLLGFSRRALFEAAPADRSVVHVAPFGAN